MMRTLLLWGVAGLLATGCLAAPTAAGPYGCTRSFVQHGKLVNEHLVPASPPPLQPLPPAHLPRGARSGSFKLLNNVPALNWCFGCAPTAAAMIFGYYDSAGYPNMYGGPSNGGVFPLTNDMWGSVVLGGYTEHLCPLVASANGLDGRASRGHVDDHWVSQGSPGRNAPDPWLTNGWALHIPDCTADFMGSNRSDWGTTDGATNFYSNADGSPMYDDSAPDSWNPPRRDGCHGLRLYAQARGYSVVTNYSQYIYGLEGRTQGFTWDQYKAELDAGRPVLIHLNGHTMTGIGYSDAQAEIIYVHDTWDHQVHELSWGGTYNGMTHYMVSVLQLAPGLNRPPTKPTTCTLTPVPATPGQNLRATADGSVDPENVTVTYSYQWSLSQDQGATWSGWNWRGALLPKTVLLPGDWWKARARAYDGTAFSGWRESTPVVIASMMASHVPASGAVITNPRGLVTIAFAARVVQASAESHFTLTQAGTPVPGTFTWLRPFATLRFTPDSALKPGYDYDVTLARGIRRRDATIINWGEQFSFSVAGSAAPALLTLATHALPTARGAQLSVTLSQPATVQASVRNLAGREVARLPERQLGSGTTTLAWERRGVTGTRLPAGTYLLQVTACATGGQEARGLATLTLGP